MKHQMQFNFASELMRQIIYIKLTITYIDFIRYLRVIRELQLLLTITDKITLVRVGMGSDTISYVVGQRYFTFRSKSVEITNTILPLCTNVRLKTVGRLMSDETNLILCRHP